MKELKTTAVRMPVRTWKRARVNTAELVLRAPDGPLPHGKALRLPEGVELFTDFAGIDLTSLDADRFLSPEAGAWIGEHADRRLIRIPKGTRVSEPITAELLLTADGPVAAEDLVVVAEEGSEATVMLRYRSEAGAAAEFTGRTRLVVRPGASLRLIRLQSAENDSLHVGEIECVVGEKGKVGLVLAELGAKQAFSSANIVLEGREAAANLDVLYLGEGERRLDMSYRVEHRGEKTRSEIRAKGILNGSSRKLFRDTLDFVSGSAGSKGREEESVLLLSPAARNISVPLLLCGEDDVEGEHAASSGRPDEKLLFYMMSRGIGETEARVLLAKAAIAAIADNIPDESAREEIWEAVSRTAAGQGLNA